VNIAGQTICLNMIVKNEAAVIRRCLDSVLPFIDYWVIVDTGSTDGTQDIIRAHLHHLPGELHQRPWRDFAHNRSEALVLAGGKADFTLIIDADDAMEFPLGSQIPQLTADCYTIDIQDVDMLYRRTQMVRGDQPWRYEGVLHEFLTCNDASSPQHLSTIRMRRNHDGARRKDPKTYQRDAAVLEAALLTETNPFLLARYRFYLAQSYKDCHEPAKALPHYLARAEMGYWQDEVFISLYRAAQMKEALGHPEGDVIDAYLRATDALPGRIEALYAASRFCRHKRRYQEGYEIAKRGQGIRAPSDGLFVETGVYETGLLDELAINAYWTGRYQESLDLCLTLLATGKLMGADMQRIVANARHAADKLPRDVTPASADANGFIEQHALVAARPLRSRLIGSPRVLLAILPDCDERSLALFLACIEALDYPKSAIVLQVCSDGPVAPILHAWIDRIGGQYSHVSLYPVDTTTDAESSGLDKQHASRRIRDDSLRSVGEHGCDFYFVADAGTFLRSCTLRELVALDLPIVAPFLRSIRPSVRYSNYHAAIDANGYYRECDQYNWILERSVRGLLEVPVVNRVYLVRADVIPGLAYDDATVRHDYVVFSENIRQRGIPQYLDNRQIYGYVGVHADDDPYTVMDIAHARQLLFDIPVP
jgi:glycosyltransferase involved in cell wall biosynthesis